MIQLIRVSIYMSESYLFWMSSFARINAFLHVSFLLCNICLWKCSKQKWAKRIITSQITPDFIRSYYRFSFLWSLYQSWKIYKVFQILVLSIMFKTVHASLPLVIRPFPDFLKTLPCSSLYFCVTSPKQNWTTGIKC